MNEKNPQYRQGDVFLERVGDLPDSRNMDGDHVVALDPDRPNSVILAYGEVTGHAHAIHADDAILYEHPTTKARHLFIVRETDLLHEEHSPIRLPAGLYLVRTQVEYTPGAVRQVAD